MRFLSLFSGIEAASMAWLPLGWECAGVAEIEKFPSAVLAHYYPGVPNLGDITRITEEQIEELGHIDLVVGGFPCQDLSVAGKRKGLKNDDGSNTRSGLFFDAMRIVRWANTRWLLLENVPGIYSSNSGRDFASVVGEILGIEFGVPANGWRNTGVAASERGLFEWATLDAQWFGVPQRRRRMFALADFGDWRSRPPVLFERQSLSGDTPPRREKGQRVADSLTVGANQCLGRPGDFVEAGTVDISHCLNAGGMGRQDYETETLITHSLRGEGFDASEDGTGRGTPLIPVAFAQNQRDEVRTMNVAGALAAEPGMKQQTYIASSMQVRRLTPRECARLQGFPDSYLDITFNGKPAADGPKYRALGNSMAVPCMAWIGKRLDEVNRISVMAKQEEVA